MERNGEKKRETLSSRPNLDPIVNNYVILHRFRLKQLFFRFYDHRRGGVVDKIANQYCRALV